MNWHSIQVGDIYIFNGKAVEILDKGKFPGSVKVETEDGEIKNLYPSSLKSVDD